MALFDICKLNKLGERIDDNNNDDILQDVSLALSSFFIPPGRPFTAISNDENEENIPSEIQFAHGTTTNAFIYQNGIILAADSRATSGNYVCSQNVQKVLQIDGHLFGTIAGCAADCEFWFRILSMFSNIYFMITNKRMPVSTAAQYLLNILNVFRGMGLTLAVILAGFDESGANLYYVDSFGMKLKSQMFSVGSGSLYGGAILSSDHKWDMTDQEAYELGRRSVLHPTVLDSYSGGTVRVYHVTEKGIATVSEEDCKDIYYKYKKDGSTTDNII